MMVGIKENNRQEIEAKLAGMGDYVKMDYLQRALKSGLDFDSRKFVLLRLAKIYEERKMFIESGKLMKAAADINTTFKAKGQDYMKSAELFIKGGDYDEAERVLKQALTCGNDSERGEMKNKFRRYFMSQAEGYMMMDKRNNAKKIYEKILSFNLNSDEKTQVQEKLIGLYEKLGLIKEYYNLKKVM